MRNFSTSTQQRTENTLLNNFEKPRKSLKLDFGTTGLTRNKNKIVPYSKQQSGHQRSRTMATSIKNLKPDDEENKNLQPLCKNEEAKAFKTAGKSTVSAE